MISFQPESSTAAVGLSIEDEVAIPELPWDRSEIAAWQGSKPACFGTESVLEA